jgi:hypothetical protein
MRLPRAAALLAAALALGACKKSGRDAPWLSMPSTAEHAVFFPIGPANVHGAPPGQSPNCDGCHADLSGYPPSTPSTTFRTFTCTGCHFEVRAGVFHDDPVAISAFHATVTTYATTVADHAGEVASLNGGVGPQRAEDGACRACHPTGFATNHAVFFPLPHQDAAGAAVAVCADCHVDYSNRSLLGCSACHPHDLPATADAHALVPGFTAADSTAGTPAIEAASALCVRCHGDGVVPVTVAGHGALPGGFIVESGTHAGDAGGACLDCHPDVRVGFQGFAADFTTTTCSVACHGTVPATAFGPHDGSGGTLAANHATAGVADFDAKVTSLGIDAACLGCHPDGGGVLPVDHPFPVGLAPAHTPEPCSRCHTSATVRNDPTLFACETCHLALEPTLPTVHAAAAIPVTDYSTLYPVPAITGPARCLYCHGDAQAYRAANHPVGDGTPEQNPQHLAAGCSNCHRTARTDAPFAADWTQRYCVDCHPNGIPP